LTSRLRRGIVARVAHDHPGMLGAAQRRTRPQRDLTVCRWRAILRFVVRTVVSPLVGRRNNSVLGRPFLLAKRAGRAARDVARCPPRGRAG
jgi:hypothetical protein